MATAITLSSTTAEGQLLECVKNIADLENTEANNPDASEIINSMNSNLEAGTVTVSLTIPITTTKGPSGNLQVTATPLFID
ncbi:hypothetical protein ACL6C3_16865 [Capilliphycus salinus ALCB114379]|uniref:hypothetical protein n=1 Tax=Capilliphycus salinus TaxID=2768948 RepID=UPI0039A63263